MSITLEGWCAKGSLVFTTGNPLYIHVTFSRSFSVGRVVNFPKFQFILSAGPLGHPPITPLCSSNWAQDPGCPSPLLDQYTRQLTVTLLCCLSVLFVLFPKEWPFLMFVPLKLDARARMPLSCPGPIHPPTCSHFVISFCPFFLFPKGREWYIRNSSSNAYLKLNYRNRKCL